MHAAFDRIYVAFELLAQPVCTIDNRMPYRVVFMVPMCCQMQSDDRINHRPLCAARGEMKRAPSAEAPPPDAERMQKIHRRLASVTSAPKVAIASLITQMYAAGLLKEGFGSASKGAERKKLGRATAKVANMATPYGPLVQSMVLSASVTWDFIHPLALLFVLTQVAPAFAKLMENCMTSEPLRLVLFVDEFKPGNVLRPDAGRSTQNFLWAFAEWPEWYLSKAGAWFTFGCLRSVHLSSIPGGISAVMKEVVLKFFDPATANLSSGIAVTTPNGSKLCRAILGGILGDEKGMKEVFGTKGPAATKPCLHCLNLVQFLSVEGHSGLQCLSSLPASFQKSSDEIVWAMVDKLCAVAVEGPAVRLAALEQQLGLHYIPEGLLFDRRLRSILSPLGGWIRDWMHSLFVFGGVANLELQQLVAKLREIGVAPSLISDFFATFRLPKDRGLVDPAWFTPKRLGKPSEEKDGWRGFAGEMLVIIPILLNFLDVAIVPRGVIPEHVACFRLLTRLTMLLTIGAERAARHIDLISDIIHQHAVLFRALYPSQVKPKFHYLFHVPDHARRLGRVMNCFVTERAHRATKTSASHVYRSYESTLARDMLNHIMTAAEDGSLFNPQHLCSDAPSFVVPHSLTEVREMRAGKDAQLKIGRVHAGDVVMAAGGIVGCVELFVSIEDSLWLVLRQWHLDATGAYRRSEAVARVVAGDEVQGALVWRADGDLATVLPPSSSAIEGPP